MVKQRTSADYITALHKMAKAGLRDSPAPNRVGSNLDMLPTLDQRLQYIFDITKPQHKHTNMLFFVMYDIESNKVRRYVVKYLERKGCIRVQKSIFLADLSHEIYNQIKSDLTEVQAVYDNNDSILVVPISTELLRSMKIIGQNIDVDLIMHNKNTLFF